MSRLLAALLTLALATPVLADTTLLNVSYDVMRDFYKDYNPAFAKYYDARFKDKLTIQQSHGGSSKQARAVIDGLEADVVTMNQSTDIDAIVEKGKQINPGWDKKLPNEAAPFSSLQVLIVRKGNPKGIKDWNDLVKPGVQVIVPNPKTSGNGRYTYLAAWGYALKQAGGNDAKARQFVTDVFKNVPVLDAGGRAATTTFMQRQIGDVLVTFENEAEMIAREFGRGGFEVVYPSVSIDADLPVAVVDKVVDKKGTRKAAEEYLKYLWSPEGQEIAAQNYLRPRDAGIAAKYAKQFPPVKLFGVNEFGGLAKAQKVHFDDGGIYDQIAAAIAKK
ncbi:sulfate transport system substrate-binding protein [Andreprevotia lacus DSM 23236]|jgi:sulfate transport system substrate-binding protein|uniref:Sulfate transport system substrate-binding protein n=1 Tax=Andreprevotia lacus DSM 23236 TaxID=1121001 RepID=A0A1W1X1D0_9NEIS|nr:sulfate ABC transporter substrate-binding protein [Andreprevotia lacus]SMC17715.1 sulfate transport system substrate-binding protein [Andreprevotia lacus DSM 23236]